MTQLENVVLWNDKWTGGKLVQVAFTVNSQNITYFYKLFDARRKTKYSINHT